MQESPANKPKSSLGMIFLVLVLMALSSVITYFVVKSSETAKQEQIVATKDNEIGELTTKMKDISKQLDDKIAEAKKLGADYKSLQTYKEQLESDIVALKQNSELSKVQVRQFQQKISAYEQMIAAKDKELTELKAKNAQLTEEKDSLLTTADSLKTTTASLSSTVSEVKESNRVLTDAASILHAENITITALNSKDKEESRNVFRHRKIDKLTIDFAVAKNVIAQAGEKEIFMRVVEPSGTVVYNEKMGSGKFTLEGNSASYTGKKSIAYNNQSQPVKLIFEKPKDYEFNAGKYTVELYCEEKQIGFKSFEVK